MNTEDPPELDERSYNRCCGRPTRSGKPCRARVYGHDVACGVHATDQDRALTAAYQRGWSEGYHQGSTSGSSLAQTRIEWLERKVHDLEQQVDDTQRYYEIDGDQVVEVGRYAYRWRGSPPLMVGDRVVLPENWVSALRSGPGTFDDVVTKLGATYRGELAHIVRRAGE